MPHITVNIVAVAVNVVVKLACITRQINLHNKIKGGKMIFTGNLHEDGSGRRILDQTKRDFFQAIEDGRPQRIENAMKIFSARQLENQIKEMERCGCHGQAEEYREALRRKMR